MKLVSLDERLTIVSEQQVHPSYSLLVFPKRSSKSRQAIDHWMHFMFMSTPHPHSIKQCQPFLVLETVSFQEALFTPSPSSSSSSASNIFNNCSVQVIQTTHPVQLPPLPPPPSSSTLIQRAPEALDVCTTNLKTDIDIQQYLDLVDFNLEELLNF